MPPAYYNVIGSEGETLSFNQYIPDGYVISMWADTSQIYLSEPVPQFANTLMVQYNQVMLLMRQL
jgi:hypothetical protein